MYFLFKILSYSPLLNIVGADDEFGDISRKSTSIRVSVFGFTLVYHIVFLSIYYDKINKKLNFDLYKAIKYPLRVNNNDNINKKIKDFKESVKKCDFEAKKIKLETIKYSIEGQKGRVQNSLLKAGYILPVFIGVLIYILQVQLSDHIDFKNIIFSVLFFCFLAVSINILYFLSKLTNVSSYTEVSLLKHDNKDDVINEALIEYYTKFVKNENRSTNYVSYNIWVQDYFKKFFLYTFLLATFLYLQNYMLPHDSKYESNKELYRSNTIEYESTSFSIKHHESFYKYLNELNSNKNNNIVIVGKNDSLNIDRVKNLEIVIEMLCSTNVVISKGFVKSDSINQNKLFLINERQEND